MVGAYEEVETGDLESKGCQRMGNHFSTWKYNQKIQKEKRRCNPGNSYLRTMT